MTVGFISGLPPARQELIFDNWIRLQRDPKGVRRHSAEVASAILFSARRAAAQFRSLRAHSAASEHENTGYANQTVSSHTTFGRGQRTTNRRGALAATT